MNTNVTPFVFPSKIGAGTRAMAHLPYDLSGFGAVRPMVVCLESVDTDGELNPLEDAFRGSGLTFGVYAMEATPTMETVREAWTHYHEGGFDAVIAVGGAVVMDVAKCLAVAGANTPDLLREMLNTGGTVSKTVPFAWVPTLDAMCGDSAPQACLGGKQINGEALVPNLIAIDPRMLSSRDPYTMAEAGLGALATALCLYEEGEIHGLIRPYVQLSVRQVMAGLLPLMGPQKTPSKGALRWFPKEKGREEEVAYVTAMAVAGALEPLAKKSLTFSLANALAPLSRVSTEVLAGVLLPWLLNHVHEQKERELSSMLMALGDMEHLCATPDPQRTGAALALLQEKINRIWLGTGARLPRTLKKAGIPRERLLECSQGVAEAIEGWHAHEIEALLLTAYEGRRVHPEMLKNGFMQEVV
ncbi:MAG: iron-containing alcohol dehydrogenase [Desulfobacterium sp.]|nr:iron-containing alcohol dehydrogenase [Desulfobacterium sp.]